MLKVPNHSTKVWSFLYSFLSVNLSFTNPSFQPMFVFFHSLLLFLITLYNPNNLGYPASLWQWSCTLYWLYISLSSSEPSHPSDNNRCWPLSACYRVPAPLCSSPRYPRGTPLPRGTTGRSEHTGEPPPVCSLQRETEKSLSDQHSSVDIWWVPTGWIKI